MLNQDSHAFLKGRYYIILPNATKYTNKFDKNVPQNMIEHGFWGGSTGLQEWKWIAIDFWTGCLEIKDAIQVKFGPLIGHFFVLVDIYLLFRTFRIFLFLLQDNKAQL